MKKIFSFFVAMMAVMAVNATKVVFDFTSTANWEAWGVALPAAGAGTDLNGKTLSLEGVQLSFAKGSGSTTVRLYQGSGNNEGKYDLRLYAGDTLTVSVSAEDTINGITCDVVITELGGEAAKEFVYTEGVTSAVFSSKANIKTLTVTVNEEVKAPEKHEVSVAQALAVGAELAGGASTEDIYAVTGYVTEVIGAVSSGQQSFWIADTKDGGRGLQSYYCSVPEAVLAGDKVVLTGNLMKYTKEGQDDIIEIKNGTTTFLEKVTRGQEDTTHVDVPEIFEGVLLTCAQAKAYAATLATGATGDVVVVVEGYITDNSGNVSRNQQTIWIADKADGGKEVQGYWTNLPDGKEAFEKGEHIYLKGKMMNYNGTAEIKNGDVLYEYTQPEKPVKPEPLEIKAGSVEYFNSDSELEFGFETSLGNLILVFKHTNANAIAGSYDLANALDILLDEKDATMTGTLDVAYASKGVYDINLLVELDKKYEGAAQLTLGEFTDDNINITPNKALAICNALGADVQTEIVYNIYGYVTKVETAYSDQYHNETFYIGNSLESTSSLYCFRCGGPEAVEVGDYICVTAKLVNYKGNTPETVQAGSKYVAITDMGTVPELLDVAVKEPTTVTVAEALEIAAKLGQNETSEEEYKVIAWVISAYEPDEKGQQTWYMADNAEETEKENELMIQFTAPDALVAAGDKMMVVGKLMHYFKAGETEADNKEYYVIRNAYAKHASGDGLFNASDDVKATKALINGQLIIERAGVQYTITGARL